MSHIGVIVELVPLLAAADIGRVEGVVLIDMVELITLDGVGEVTELIIIRGVLEAEVGGVEGWELVEIGRVVEVSGLVEAGGNVEVFRLVEAGGMVVGCELSEVAEGCE